MTSQPGLKSSQSIDTKSEIFENIRCIVCQNQDKERFQVKYQKENCTIVECQKCEFHFIPPCFRKSVDYSKYKSTAAVKEVAKGDIWLKIQRNLLRFGLIQKYQPSGKIYDIGCGFGHFLLTGKQLGYEVTGVEMSSANVGFIKNEFSIKVEENDFLKVSEAQPYDIMTLWDVLEHIDSADRIMEKVSRMLRPGGYVFIQVPQIDSFFATLLKDNWWAMGLDHVNYFSKKTIKQLLANHGMEIVTIKSSLELKNLFLYVILPKLRHKKKSDKTWTTVERQKEFNKLTKKPSWIRHLMVKAHNAIYKTFSLLHIGDEMIVVGRKML